MNANDDVGARRARLQALRERYTQQPAATDNLDLDDSDLDDVPLPQRRGPGGPGRGRGEEKRPGAVMQRVVQFLTQPGAGNGNLIPGTRISEDRLKQAMRFLEQRAQTASGGRGQRLQKLYAQLTQAGPGQTLVAGVNIARLQQVIERLERQSDKVAAEPAPTPAPEPAPLPAPLPAPVVAPSPAPAAAAVVVTPAVEQTLQQLVELTQRLSEQLAEAQQRIEHLSRAREQDTPPAAPAAQPAPRRLLNAGADDSDWFEDFLE